MSIQLFILMSINIHFSQSIIQRRTPPLPLSIYYDSKYILNTLLEYVRHWECEVFLKMFHHMTLIWLFLLTMAALCTGRCCLHPMIEKCRRYESGLGWSETEARPANIYQQALCSVCYGHDVLYYFYTITSFRLVKRPFADVNISSHTWRVN